MAVPQAPEIIVFPTTTTNTNTRTGTSTSANTSTSTNMTFTSTVVAAASTVAHATDVPLAHPPRNSVRLESVVREKVFELEMVKKKSQSICVP